MNDPVEEAYREYMRALARKGGAVTKRRHGCDPCYYRNIGRRGGQASVAARKARIAADLDGAKLGEAPILEHGAASAQGRIAEPIDTVPNTARRRVITELLAARKRFGPRQPEVSEHQRILDAMAQEHMARVLAQARDSHDVEPFDPWD